MADILGDMNGDEVVELRDVKTTSSLKRKVMIASGWTFAGSYTSQALRLVSNLIITRLLFPEAFGLMALVNVFLQLLQTFSDIGIGPSIIQTKRGEEEGFLCTAWTIQIIRGFGLWFVSCVIAVGLWYGQSLGLITGDSAYADPMLPMLVSIGGLSAIISGFNSTSLFTHNRNLALGRLTILEVVGQIVSIAVMIVGAMIWRSVWVLLIGGLAGGLVRMLGSHLLLRGVRHRLHWDRATAGDLYRFGRWIFGSTLLGFVRSRGNRLLLGVFLSASQLGLFVIGMELATFANKVIARLDQKVLFPAYVKIAQNGIERLRSRIYKARLVIFFITIPPLTILVMFGQIIVEVLYDPRYEGAGIILRILAAGALASPDVRGMSALLALGDSFRRMLIFAAMIVGMFAGMIAGVYLYGELGLVAGLAFGPLLSYPVMVWAIKRYGLWMPGFDALRFGIGCAIVVPAFYVFPVSSLDFVSVVEMAVGVVF